MYKSIVSLILTIAISVITILHIYWMIGGKKWLNDISPTNLDKWQKLIATQYWKIFSFILFSPIVICLITIIIALQPSIFEFIIKYNEKIYLFVGIFLMLRGISVNFINKFCSNQRFIFLNSRLYAPISNLLGLLFLSLLI